MDSKARAAKAGFFALIAVASAAFGAPACSGGENPSPTTSSSSSSGGTTTTSEGTGGSGGSTSTGGSGGTGTANCDGPNGCFNCPPKKTPEFLNACTDAQCSPFDNAARLPLYNGGNLPPLP